MSEERVSVFGIRFSVQDETGEVGRAFLYILRNDLHEAPFGLLEDVFVKSEARNSGTGRQLLDQVVKRAQKEGCYKLIATSRSNGTRDGIHAWYKRLGFRSYGVEFRMDF